MKFSFLWLFEPCSSVWAQFYNFSVYLGCAKVRIFRIFLKDWGRLCTGVHQIDFKIHPFQWARRTFAGIHWWESHTTCTFGNPINCIPALFEIDSFHTFRRDLSYSVKKVLCYLTGFRTTWPWTAMFLRVCFHKIRSCPKKAHLMILIDEYKDATLHVGPFAVVDVLWFTSSLRSHSYAEWL